MVTLGNLVADIDAPISILLEDCEVGWRDAFPFQSPYYDSTGILVDAGPSFGSATPAGSVTVRGGTVRGSAGAGIGIYKKHLDAPAVTFDSVTLVDTGRLDKGVLFSWGAPGYPVHVTPIMLMDNDGGLGGLWFENVVVVMGPQQSPARPFLSYNQWPCDPGIPCPNVTGAIGGRIEVQWRGSAAQCVPRLLGEGGAPLPNGTLFGHALLENVSITCTKAGAVGPGT